ncbi:hypothetical protein NIZ92_17720 [Alcaligenes sp. 1735tsa3]|uniref:hypothetical protein n=1 Tax=Alcaligenes sp. 1735tsa3 TaxID=2953809 RepID=UPI0020A79DF5|nr:hypothetical protein [Alcaligenes sp. 1735tsa3]USY25119.1 hypothetical protein NIZ92_17720 [Alcaligenes sp. 1735tsa3]
MSFDTPNYTRLNTPIYHFTSVEEAVPNFSHEGLYSINIGHPDLPLDLLVKNFNNTRKDTVIIAFAGAVPNRQQKSPPFFEFTGISQQLSSSVPFIAIADPSLYMDQTLNLAWYAGNKYLPDLQQQIARLLDLIAEFYGCRLVLLGASGGGFAALNTLAILSTDNASVFTWNPQIKIANYEAWAVKRYLSTCFEIPSDEMLTHENLEKAIAKIGVSGEAQHKRGKGKIVYFINDTDIPHIFRHMKKYFQAATMEKINDQNFLSGNTLVHIGHFGNGHAGPSKDIVIEAVNDVVSDRHPLVHKCLGYKAPRPPLWLNPQTSYELRDSGPEYYLFDHKLICIFPLRQYGSYIIRWLVSDQLLGTQKQFDWGTNTLLALDLKHFSSSSKLTSVLEVEGLFGRTKIYTRTLDISLVQPLVAL